MPAKSLELQHTIRLIRELDAEIEEIEAAIQTIMDELHSPITTWGVIANSYSFKFIGASAREGDDVVTLENLLLKQIGRCGNNV